MDPLRTHYLKKALISLQLTRELAQLHRASVALLGPPFHNSDPNVDHLPLLTFLFQHFLLSFPFLAAAPPDFYPHKLQPFLDSLLARNLFDDPDAILPSPTSRLERTLAIFFSSAIKLAEPEDVLRISQADLQSLERAVNNRLAKRTARTAFFRVNIVCVRTVTDRGRVRSRVHEEFIIRTSLSHDRHVCVSRRYGDFKTLVDELRNAHPDSIVPPPPPKDRTAVTLHANSLLPPPRLSRERNRLTLRAYLHSLLATHPFSSSPVLRSFLLSGPTHLSQQEHDDARRREEADRVRDQGRIHFAREIGARVDHLRDAVRTVKSDVVGRGGLSRVFAIIKVTPHVRQLPDNYQAVMEWARISLASTIFQTFVASDNSPDTFASLKRIHGLMPYFLLKGALKISNPVAMIRNVLDIFLAQPFGGHSLLQRMFTSSLSEEVKTLNTYVERVSAKIDSPILCDKVRAFVYAPREIQETYRVNARLQRTHLLKSVLMGGGQPRLSRSLAARVDRASSKWAAWMAERQRQGRGKRDDNDSEDGPDDEEAWLFEDLRVLINLYSRLRDREQLIALIFEGVTADLLKDIITIFYTPLAQVYRAASIADSLGDLQNFINDLIHTVEQTEDLSQSDPSSTVQTFIDLVNRHEQSFYSFVHKVHSKGQGLFDSLMKWVERFLTAIREGIGASDLSGEGNRIVLEALLPAGDEDRTKIMEEVDQLMHWHYINKIAREEKIRSRFRRAQKGAEKDADAEDDATRLLVDGIAREFDFGDLIRANANELAEEESDEIEDSDDYDEDSDEEGTSDEDSSNETNSNDAEADMTTPKNLQSCAVRSSTMHPPLSRAKTIQAAVPPTPPKPQSQPPSLPQPVPPRTRSLSLRSIKSIKLPGKHHPPAADIPPVPPVPVYFNNNKAAPPRLPEPSSASLSRRRSTGHLASFPDQGSGGNPQPPSPRRPSRKPRKKAAATTQPPELTHIPTLLPLFVEMMRPLLRPQS